MASTRARAPKGVRKGRVAWEGQQQSVAERSGEAPLMTTLRAEHRHIAGIMKLFERQLDAIDNAQLVDPHLVYEIMEYMVSWPDRYHHPREDLVYARVAQLDAEAADNVDTLQREHDEMASRGQQLLAAIERWQGGRGNGEEVVEKGRDYIDRTYTHMSSEEALVFPQIESILADEDWRDLVRDDQLRPVRDPVFGPRVQRQYRNLARKLRRGVRRRVERSAMTEWITLDALMESLDVLSMAREATADATGEHLRGALRDALRHVRQTPLSAPLKCVASNSRHTWDWAEKVFKISRETLDDLQRVNRERRDHMALLQRD